MIIDGKQIAGELQEELRHALSKREAPLHLSVFVLKHDAATKQFIGIKKRIGESLGVVVKYIELPEHISTHTFLKELHDQADRADGVIVQLPLPGHISLDAGYESLPLTKDVDAIGEEAFLSLQGATATVLPPVVGAIKEILKRESYVLSGKKVVVLGHGRLVGNPAALWALQQGADVSVCTEETENVTEFTQKADVIICGAGVPGLLKPHMVKDGVVILDAGASETGGQVVGDADPRCAEKALLFSPVPGGIGPIAVTMIFKNLCILNGIDLSGE